MLIKENTNPDILYGIEFVQVHVTATTMLLLLFVPKVTAQTQKAIFTELIISKCTNYTSKIDIYQVYPGYLVFSGGTRLR